MEINLNVNGSPYTVDVEPETPLLWVLRDNIGLTGTKYGCGIQQCGACTVHLDGVAAKSCGTTAAAASGRAITTIEGLAAGGALTDIQGALIGFGGTQCGICTPGIALCASRVLAAEPEAPRARLRELLSGNICRCTGYQLIVDALVEVAERRRGARS